MKLNTSAPGFQPVRRDPWEFHGNEAEKLLPAH